MRKLAGALVMLLMLVMLGLSASAAQAASAPDAIVGTWLTEDGAPKVEVSAGKAADGSTVYDGKVAWLKQLMRDGQALRDANNSDAALRERPILAGSPRHSHQARLGKTASSTARCSTGQCCIADARRGDVRGIPFKGRSASFSRNKSERRPAKRGPGSDAREHSK